MRRSVFLGRARSVLAALLVASALLAAALPRPALADEHEKVTCLTGKTAGVMAGTPQDEVALSAADGVEVQYFNSMTDLVLALQSHKIDFFVLSSVNYYSIAEDYPELGYIDQSLQTYDVGTIFPPNERGEALRAQFNEYVATITESGELTRLQDYWLMPNEWENFSIPATGENGTLHMATSNTLKPFSMELNGQNAGFDIAVVAGFCEAYGYGLQIDNVEFSGALTGISTGMYDLAAGQISWTEERSQSVLFSDFYYTQQIVPIVRAEDFPDEGVVTAADSASPSASAASSAASAASGSTSGAASSSQSGDKSLLTSIRRTLVDQDRWKSVLAGLGTTLVITLAGFVLANVLGALLCAAALSGSRAARAVSRGYCGLMQGIPIVVVLMVLYYVVLAGAKLNNVLVASLGFGLVFAANMAQLFEGGISGVEAGQWEAALASGLTKHQAFYGIILPQAARTSLPGYFSNLISLMKGTAVVGYIAVADLTRAGDVIRSSTYEAFVPIITVALIYLAITCLMLALMSLVRRLLTKPRARKVGGRA